MTVESETPHGRVLAAVDLGSNSFHMIVAREKAGELRILDRLREMVRLADGLDKKRRLSEAKQQEALDALARFGERLRVLHASNVRAVGTNTLRQAKNGDAFLQVAEQALGHPIDVISGREEARLVYSGAIHDAPTTDKRRLVMDIGGGSTELVSGCGDTPDSLYSLFIGCVSVSKQFFPDGTVSKAQLAKARVAVDRQLTPVIGPLKSLGWQQVLGCSGTFRAVARAAHELDPSTDRIDASDIDGLVARFLKAGNVADVGLTSLGERRRPVFFGGLVIVERLFAGLGLKNLRVTDGALREGLVYDMLGSRAGIDPRARSVSALERRYRVDTAQADRVEGLLLALLESVSDKWGINKRKALRLLSYAARLHEIGLSIAHSHYHRHGAYILAHADLPGFSRQEQSVVAWLIGGHRQRVPANLPQHYRPSWFDRLPRMLALLRIAVLLARARQQTHLPKIDAKVKNDTLILRWPQGWLEHHPLSYADLEEESERLKKLGITLRIEDSESVAVD